MNKTAPYTPENTKWIVDGGDWCVYFFGNILKMWEKKQL